VGAVADATNILKDLKLGNQINVDAGYVTHHTGGNEFVNCGWRATEVS
jgi:hypothetical protein